MNQKSLRDISAYLRSYLNVFSRPQQSHFFSYLAGLIWIIRFRSIKEIARQLQGKTWDGLHHFLVNSPWRTEEIYQENHSRIRQIGNQNAGRKILTLDDTPCPREGPKIVGTGWHHGADGLVKGLCAVTSLFMIGKLRLIWTIWGYRPKKSCAKEEFKSKVEIALEVLNQTVFLGWGLTVLMDSWYGCSKILNFIKEQGWIFLSAIKCNRLVWINGRKTRLSHLAKGRRVYKTVKLGKKRRFRIAKLKVYLPKVGEVLLFISKSSKGTRFFATNDLEMTEREMGELYSQRFWIETMHQEIKGHLGFGEIFMRSWCGVQKHWACMVVAYNIITLWNYSRSRRFKTFGQTIKRWREKFSPKMFIELCNAA